MRPKIAVVGSVNWDMSMRLPSLPLPRETVHGGICSCSLGGKGANQAVAAARAGGEVFFLACVGNDSVGADIRQELEANAISTANLVTVDNVESGKAMIFVDRQGENCIGVASGANAHLLPEHLNAFAPELTKADTLLLQMEISPLTAIAAINMAAGSNIPVILNPAPAPREPLSDEWLNSISVLTPNQVEMERIAGTALTCTSDLRAATRKLLDKGLHAVLVTLGAEGVYVAGQEGDFRIPAFSVTAVDTTAAGDVFNGALAVALAGKEDLRQAVEFASAAAALSVSVPGAIPSIPQRTQIQAFLAGQSS